MKFFRFLLLPILVFALVVWSFTNTKAWATGFGWEDHLYGSSVLVKYLLLTLLPIGLLHTSIPLRQASGLHFGETKSSLQLAWTAFYLLGPACASFMLIALLGLSFKDWYGSAILTVVFSVVLYFIPRITKQLPTFEEAERPFGKRIYWLVLLALLTVLWAFYVPTERPIPYKICYFIFIVSLGEEVFFRGYLQSSFNLYFGKPFQLYGVKYGWGLILASLFFGLIHSLVTVPIAWPWMLFTFVGGLILGFVREKDGSLLAPIILHTLMDFPLVFMMA